MPGYNENQLVFLGMNPGGGYKSTCKAEVFWLDTSRFLHRDSKLLTGIYPVNGDYQLDPNTGSSAWLSNNNDVIVNGRRQGGNAARYRLNADGSVTWWGWEGREHTSS